MPLRTILPRSMRAPLWGDRSRWGLSPDLDDPCWQKWQTTYTDFYKANQREGIGTRVNDAGYSVMSSLDLTGKRVLEIGAGDIRHIKYWQAASTCLAAQVQENTTIDPDKIICWEHPNFADRIVGELDQVFTRQAVGYWPLSWLPLLDLNLLIRLYYRKSAE